MAERNAGDALDTVRRLPVGELAFPALFQNVFFIWRDAYSIKGWRGLLIDSNGCSYHAVNVQVPRRSIWRRVTWRPRRSHTADVGVSGFLFYRGEQVTLSVNDVRDKIVWLVSAVGDFERPLGLPSAILWAQSVEELLQVLLAAGWHTLRFGSR